MTPQEQADDRARRMQLMRFAQMADELRYDRAVGSLEAYESRLREAIEESHELQRLRAIHQAIKGEAG